MNKPNPAPEPTMEEILASIRRIISDGDEAATAAAADAEPDDIPEIAEDIPEVPDEEPVEDLGESSEADADIFDLTDDMVAEVAESPEPVVEDLEEDEPVSAGIEEPSPSEEIDLDDIDKIMAGEMAIDNDVDTVVEEIVEPEMLEVAFDEPEAAAEPEAVEPDTIESAPEEPEPVEPEPAVSVKPEQRTDPKSMSGLLSPQSDAVVASAFDRLASTILTQDPRTLEDLVGDMLRPMLKDWLDDNLPGLVEKLVREEIERVSRGRR